MPSRNIPAAQMRRTLKQRAAVLALCVTLSAASAGSAEPPTPVPETIPAFVLEASDRFAIPESWIRAVMRAESGGDTAAVSPKGAMGLMQIMPKTWETLSARYGLGDDPFDPRDNILAGAGYLRELFDRFGSPGFLAAYNAGPGRYEEHLATGRRLPGETRAYLAKLAPKVGAAVPHVTLPVSTETESWAAAPLFVTLRTRTPNNSETVDRATAEASPDASPPAIVVADLAGQETPADSVFVPRAADAPFR